MDKVVLDKLLALAVGQQASDIHLSAGCPPILRIHGRLRRLKADPIPPEAMASLLDSLLTEAQREQYHRDLQIDLAYEVPGVGRFRCNAYRQSRGDALALRVIPERIPVLEQLGAPAVLASFARLRKGLVLVTGPTGSGKSTTLAALIDRINEERHDHIITIEDPIEYVHRPKNCLINQRELGSHTRSFADALRAALREDPDVILVGEMRDLETIALALTAAETGHLVFSTLHTINAPETVNRVVDVFPAAQQAQIRSLFANCVAGVISQCLLPRKDGKGRVAAFEVMVATTAVRNLIREAKSHQLPSVIQTSGDVGMQTMEQAIQKLVDQGLVDPAEARSYLAPTDSLRKANAA
ncbi:MAG: type IV pilus twitching motility protein PilT [candidate division KSB1 bacterium]|nr:type IV pilus twitching motility protein PilT [candidate division KSB1 bacterium]